MGSKIQNIIKGQQDLNKITAVQQPQHKVSQLDKNKLRSAGPKVKYLAECKI